jgi:hypothetical protein
MVFPNLESESNVDMVTDRRKNYLHAAIVDAAVRLACDGRLARAPALLREEGIGIAVQTRVLSPLGERRRPQDVSSSLDRDAPERSAGFSISLR